MSGPSLQALLSHFLGDKDDNSDWGRGFQDFIQNDVFFFFFLSSSQSQEQNKIQLPSQLTIKSES